MLYKTNKKEPMGRKDAFTESAMVTPGAPAVAKKRYKSEVPNVSPVDRSWDVGTGKRDVNRMVSNVETGRAPDDPPSVSPNHVMTEAKAIVAEIVSRFIPWCVLMVE
jgi:hypothetical protein